MSVEQWFQDVRRRELDQFEVGDEVTVVLHGECRPGVKHGNRELGLRGTVLATDGGHHTNPDREGHPIWVKFRTVNWSWFYTPGEIRPFDMLRGIDWTPEERAALVAGDQPEAARELPKDDREETC